jgi:cytochrome bd-type quinol oxidase subunit 1
VNPGELAFTLGLIVLLLGLAGYFGWRQLRALRGITGPDELGQGDRRFLHSQAFRRLFCSLLMVFFAGMLIGWIFLEARYRELVDEMHAAEIVDPSVQASQEQKDFVRFISVYWMVALLVLLVMVSLAAIDFWAIARYGLSQHRRLQADRRALLEEQAARRRRERNGTR